MWFFIVSDALTFSGFLAAYGFSRFKFIETWPIADEVFTHIPFVHGNYPMYYVAFMTFVLIFSSVTMVLAVDAGKHMKQGKVILYMGLTIIGGLIFLGSQAWEWKTFIAGSYGAVQLEDGKILRDYFENIQASSINSVNDDSCECLFVITVNLPSGVEYEIDNPLAIALNVVFVNSSKCELC